MPEMSTLSGKSKVPVLPSQGASYAKWGRWVGAFSSCLTLKGLHLFAALDSTMPVEFPEVEDEGESEGEETKDVKARTELLNVLTLQYKVANKYEFSAKSAEAYALLYEAATVVAKPHFPWTKIVISSDEKRRSSRSLPGPFAAEQPTDASYLSRVVRCAPASDEAPRGPNWQSINRRTRRPKFHDERPATPRCLLALPTEASSFP